MPALAQIASEANGYVTSSQADKLGIPRRKFAEAVAAGELVRISPRGVN